MAAPKRPNTAAATAARVREGDESAAARLRDHGWVVIPPGEVAELPLQGVLRTIAGLAFRADTSNTDAVSDALAEIHRQAHVATNPAERP